MASITISDEYASLVPELSPQEYESLKQSIKENGLYVPIILNQYGVILDGHHRYKICQELGMEPKTQVRESKDESYEKLFVIGCNLTRRHLNNFQKTELALKSKPILEAIIKKNESLGGKGDRNLTPLGRVDEQIGKLAGVSRDTVRKVEKIDGNATQEVKHALRIGEATINEIFQDIKGREKKSASLAEISTRQSMTPSPTTAIIKEERENYEQLDERYESFRILIKDLSGLDYSEQTRISDNNRELVEKTKQHRFDMVKKMTDADVKATYGFGQTLSRLLTDLLEQLDDEMDSRKRKSQLVSE